MVAKKRETIPHESSYKAVEERVTAANRVHNFIGAMAYGKEPTTFSMPEELAGTPFGGTHTTPLSLPDPNDDATAVPLAKIMSFAKEGIDIGQPGEIVRRAWEAPPATPMAKGTFMQRYQETRKKAPNPKELVSLFARKTKEVVTNPHFSESKKELGLTASSTPETIFDKMVQSRKGHFSHQLTDWYEGKRTGVNEQGYPEYERGAAVAAIENKAAEINVPQSVLRRGVAIGSPKTVWESQAGHMPNLEGAARTTEIALTEPELSAPEVSAKMKKEFKEQPKGKKATILKNMGELVARSARGEMSAPHEPMSPPQGQQIGAEKISNFDLNLVNPHHPEYGYSSYVAWLSSQGHTSDTHDLGAAGIKTPSIPRTDKQGRPKFKKTEEGVAPDLFNAGEEWAKKAGGHDILGATARVASAEQFMEDYEHVGRTHGAEAQYAWARENAHRYVSSNKQAEQWIESQQRSKRKSTARRVKSAQERRKKK